MPQQRLHHPPLITWPFPIIPIMRLLHHLLHIITPLHIILLSIHTESLRRLLLLHLRSITICPTFPQTYHRQRRVHPNTMIFTAILQRPVLP